MWRVDEPSARLTPELSVGAANVSLGRLFSSVSRIVGVFVVGLFSGRLQPPRFHSRETIFRPQNDPAGAK